MQPDLPAIPGYAWAWLQRSRPVLTAVSQRLTGGPPGPGFLDDLRASFAEDAFTRQIVADVVVEVAFSGQIPQRRPAGVSWDRGLTWWAATLAGTSPAEFSNREPQGDQVPLFEPPAPQPRPTGVKPRKAPEARRRSPRGQVAEAPAPEARAGVERKAIIGALRALLDTSDGGQVPASAVRQLLAQLEERDRRA